MIYLTDTPPTFCPNCGRKTTTDKWDRYAYDDWEAGCSHACLSCATKYQRVPTADLIEAADRHGDLKQYATE